uniref:G_PROTEIN_RECEP_F1_2 domain-containing protein n=1 Tax=Rhabditophanes sp. KR3021 TaxID=114890 RepID=A0AC35TQ45_9BILA
MVLTVYPKLNILALFILPLLCVSGLIGNILVCIAISINPKLHNVTNYFLFSLAIADLLVCVIVMPFSIFVEVRDGKFDGRSWNWNFELCLTYMGADVYLCSASIVHMTMISIDRYIGISKPLAARNRSKTTILLKILLVWVITAIITSPIIVLSLWDHSNILYDSVCLIRNRYYMVYGSTLIFLIPFLVMLLAYFKTTRLLGNQKLSSSFETSSRNGNGLRRTIQRKKKKIEDGKRCDCVKDSREMKPLMENESNENINTHRSTTDFRTAVLMRSLSRHLIKRYALLPRSSSVESEVKASKVLRIVFGCFFICWSPFFVNNFLAGFCGSLCEPPPWVGVLFLWLGFCSSIVNPIIYTIFNKKFRQTFLQILKCHRANKGTGSEEQKRSFRTSSRNYAYMAGGENNTTGLIRGKKSALTDSGKYGYIFQNVPYAAAPINSLRFEMPQQPLPWQGIRDATSYGNVCLWNSTQSKHDPYYGRMDEDCLNLNIYVSPNCLTKGSCPTVLFIHGGAFTFTSPQLNEEATLIENFASNGRDVIFISLNFRYGIFGFLNLNYKLDLSIPKNQGMFDIIAALKFIKKEIRTFGGDPAKVTLQGHSSGAICASSVYLSEKAKGLFSNAILMSGNLLQSTFVNNNQNISRVIAGEGGCAFIDTNWDSLKEVEDVIGCLKKLDGVKLVGLQYQAEKFGLRINGPILDYGPEALFGKSLDVIRQQFPNVPLMIGTTKMEDLSSNPTLLDKFKRVIPERLNDLCNYAVSFRNYKNQTNALNECIKRYSSDHLQAQQIINELNYFSTLLRDARSAVISNASVYVYSFEYQYVMGAFDTYGEMIPKELRPLHSEELPYITGNHKGVFMEKDYKVRDIVSELFVNFIKTGNPTTVNAKFDKYNPITNNYFLIDFDANYSMAGMKMNYHKDTDEYFNKLLMNVTGGFTDNLDEERIVKAQIQIMTGNGEVEFPLITYGREFYEGKAFLALKSSATTQTIPMSNSPNSIGITAMTIIGIVLLIFIGCLSRKTLIAKKNIAGYETFT